MSKERIHIPREAVTFEHAYFMDDGYPSRQYWHCRLIFHGLHSRWQKYGEPGEEPTSVQRQEVENFLYMRFQHADGKESL